MTDGQNRAVLYARKSTKQDRTEEQSASVADQLERCREYATERGWTVVTNPHDPSGEFKDDGRSGLLDRSKRPGLDAALSVIESGGADVLVTLWTSRLSREERDRAEILDVLDLVGVEWHATEDGGRIDRSTYAGYIQYGIHTIFDVAYSKRVGENWRRAHDKRIEAGLPKTTNPQFGYDYEYETTERGRRINGRYVINAAEAEVVRELYRRYSNGKRGDGFTQLVRWLNAEGWRVKGTGNEWSVRTLSRFMDVGFAAGFISREAHLRDMRGSHEPLIGEDEWLAYRAQREKQAKLGKKASGAGDRWWLAGLVKCGACGSGVYVDSYARASSLVCCAGKRGNPGSCDGSAILRSYVEGAVGLWLGGHLDQLEQLVGIESREVENASARVFQEAVAERDRIADGLADLEVSKALGDIQPAVFQRAKEKLTMQLTVAESAMKAAAATMQETEAPDLDLLRNGDSWSADRRAALAGVLDRVEVHKDSLKITPVTGEPVTWTRAELAPRCNVDGCDRIHYTRGLCKSHGMRARNLGILDELAARVAASVGAPGPTVTVDEVDALFAEASQRRTQADSRAC